jgi:hypothetical protein
MLYVLCFLIALVIFHLNEDLNAIHSASFNF